MTRFIALLATPENNTINIEADRMEVDENTVMAFKRSGNISNLVAVIDKSVMISAFLSERTS